jgi:hypothetical protein
MWIPSQPQQQQTTFNPTNQIYKSEIIINQIPKTVKYFLFNQIFY